MERNDLLLAVQSSAAPALSQHSSPLSDDLNCNNGNDNAKDNVDNEPYPEVFLWFSFLRADERSICSFPASLCKSAAQAGMENVKNTLGGGTDTHGETTNVWET